jgi:hypothetical protein
MFHMLLLVTFTVGIATLTFALMALASLAGAGYRSSAVGRFRFSHRGLSPSVASDGMPPLPGPGASPPAPRGSTPDRSELGA